MEILANNIYQAWSLTSQQFKSLSGYMLEPKNSNKLVQHNGGNKYTLETVNEDTLFMYCHGDVLFQAFNSEYPRNNRGIQIIKSNLNVESKTYPEDTKPSQDFVVSLRGSI
jgi:hypothetical protein